MDLGGITHKIKVAHFRLCHSRKPFVVAYHRESLEMVLDAHMRALTFFQGIPRKVIIDNPKTMVTAIGAGKSRQFNARFLSIMNHYLIEPWHYVPILKRKPGALRNGAPFKDWDLPRAIQRIRLRYLKRPGGDREFVELLLMVQRHDLDTVNTACELALALALALAQGTGHLCTIENILHRLTEQQQPAALNVVNYPRIDALPEANCQRYDGLMREVAHAEPC